MICSLCKGATSSLSCENLCDRCYQTIMGKSPFPNSYDRKWQGLGIVVFIKDEKIRTAWKDNGSTSINLKIYDCSDVFGTIKKMINDKDKVLCSQCGCECSKNKRHFASIFCEKCWEEYKKENTKICGICKNPYWKCTC